MRRMERRARVIPIFIALGVGCTPSSIVQQYAAYSGCPQSEIDVVERPIEGGYRASGCKNGATFYCRESNDDCASPLIVVARRHAKQFSCTPEEAKVEDLGADAFLAKGCGRRVTYQCFEDRRYVVRCVAEAGALDSRGRGSTPEAERPPAPASE
jgi:hypothetical protein